MKVDRQTHAAHGAAILDAASHLFRGHGIDRVGIADVTRAAGLTHGAFYGHFPSKAALAEAVCRDGLALSANRWRDRAARARAEGRCPLAAIIDSYLTEQHRDVPGEGCVLPALGADIARTETPTRTALAEGTGMLVDVLAEQIAARHPDWQIDQTRCAADAVMVAMLGGVLLARAVATDPARSRIALATAARLARAAADLPGKD